MVDGFFLIETIKNLKQKVGTSFFLFHYISFHNNVRKDDVFEKIFKTPITIIKAGHGFFLRN